MREIGYWLRLQGKDLTIRDAKEMMAPWYEQDFIEGLFKYDNDSDPLDGVDMCYVDGFYGFYDYLDEGTKTVVILEGGDKIEYTAKVEVEFYGGGLRESGLGGNYMLSTHGLEDGIELYAEIPLYEDEAIEYEADNAEDYRQLLQEKEELEQQIREAEFYNGIDLSYAFGKQLEILEEKIEDEKQELIQKYVDDYWEDWSHKELKSMIIEQATSIGIDKNDLRFV